MFLNAVWLRHGWKFKMVGKSHSYTWFTTSFQLDDHFNLFFMVYSFYNPFSCHSRLGRPLWNSQSWTNGEVLLTPSNNPFRIVCSGVPEGWTPHIVPRKSPRNALHCQYLPMSGQVGTIQGGICPLVELICFTTRTYSDFALFTHFIPLFIAFAFISTYWGHRYTDNHCY